MAAELLFIVTIQEFISYWQAAPFRPFRIHAVQGAFDVAYPAQVAISPTLRLLVAIDGIRVEDFAFEDVIRCESTGPAAALAAVMAFVPPERLGRDAQLLAGATRDSAAETAARAAHAAACDPGVVRFLTAYAPEGIFLVHVAVQTREGVPVFSTAGTRWNVHGMEPFENGTALFLHHRDHPTVEQRILLWPPDRGTFESFAEARTMPELRAELERRDAAGTANPATASEPSARYWQQLAPRELRGSPPASQRGRDGEPLPYDPARHRLELSPHEVGPNQWAQSPAVIDDATQEVLFDLRDSSWDADVTAAGPDWTMVLRHWPDGQRGLTLTLDVATRDIRIEDAETRWPLGFVERHLWNFPLHDDWSGLRAALRAGPPPPGAPELVQAIGGGYRVDWWPGPTRFPLPFLQPHFRRPDGRTLLDLRETYWAARVHRDAQYPRAWLHLVSDEREKRYEAARFGLVLDLQRERVTCRELEGSTSLGMLQALVRRVRGVTWMMEELRALFARGRFVPQPSPLPDE